MSGSKKALIIISVIAICLSGGWYFYSNNVTPSDTSQNLANSDDLKDYDGYVASIPQYGPLIQTQQIKVKYEGDKAFGTLKLEDTAAIAPFQKVILFDKEGFILPLGAKVTDVQTGENSSDITIELPRDTHSELLSDELEIIKLETKASKRLPLSAIQRDDNDKAYIWVVEKEEEEEEEAKKQKLRRQYIEVGMQDDRYFEEFGQTLGAFDLVLLNPDSKIKSDKAYKIKKIKFNAPAHNPIKQAWIDFEVNQLAEQQEQLAIALAECRARAAAKKNGDAPQGNGAATTGSSSCGSPPAFQGTDPFAVFDSLTNRQNLNLER